MSVKIHAGLPGLHDLSEQLTGEETLHVGIRPFGLHAGNMLGIVAYPHLLFRAVRELGKPCRFRLLVSINDWEQDAPSGPDPVRFPYNIVPKTTTLQFSRTESGASSVDVWEPRIRAAYSAARDEFPDVHIETRRTSQLRSQPGCALFLARTLENAGLIGECLAENSTHQVLLDGPLLFASVVCQRCRAARGKTRFLEDGEHVDFACANCGLGDRGLYSNFDWWWHHKPMFLARWFLWDIDVAISGGDHMSDGDGVIRDRLRAEFHLPERNLTMLFAPLLVDDRGIKVSKSGRNEIDLPYESLLRRAGSDPELRMSVSSFLNSNGAGGPPRRASIPGGNN